MSYERVTGIVKIHMAYLVGIICSENTKLKTLNLTVLEYMMYFDLILCDYIILNSFSNNLYHRDETTANSMKSKTICLILKSYWNCKMALRIRPPNADIRKGETSHTAIA